MTFRKKPLIIEAEQYLVGKTLPKGICDSSSCHRNGYNNVPHLHTIHGNQIVILADGDFVIPEPDGTHYYPCKPDIFLASYDPV